MLPFSLAVQKARQYGFRVSCEWAPTKGNVAFTVKGHSTVAISSIALHNAKASPALRISVLPNSNFAIQSNTQDPIEYVQDTEISSTAASLSTPTEIPTISLLLKAQADEEFQLSFELKGHVLESLSAASNTANTANEQLNGKMSTAGKESITEQDKSTHVSQGSNTTSSQIITTSVEGDDIAAEDPNKERLLRSDEGQAVSLESSSTDVVENSSEAPVSVQQYHHGPVFFTEANSQTDILELCRESVLEQQLKDQNVYAVDVQPLLDENTTPGQGIVNQTFTWSWRYPSKDYTKGHAGRKTIFAVDSRARETDTHAELRISATYGTLTSNSRHSRHSSTPERFTSSISRFQSFHTKGLSLPSSHASLPSLPDAAVGTTGQGSIQDSSGPLTGSLSNLNPTAFAIDTEDGPLFRATVLECENNIRDMKASTKKIIKAAQTVLEARKSLMATEEAFIKELEGFRPAEPLLNNYLRPMTQSLVERSDVLAHQMRTLLIDPLNRFYLNDIKAAEAHRKTFDDESKEYYQTLSRYMAMKQDNNRKKSEADAKYEKKRKQFEIKRFEYWCFLLDMRIGGSKSDEILHHLTNYSEKHCKSMMDIAVLAEDMKFGLEIIAADLLESHKRAATIRKERQERKKELLDTNDESHSPIPHPPAILKGGSNQLSSGPAILSPSSGSDIPLENNLDNLNTIQEVSDDTHEGSPVADQRMPLGASPTSSAVLGSAPLNNGSIPKFSGIRDLEHQDIDANLALGRRKEGFLFATSRPSSHNNSTVLEKSGINWHKYWCVVSEGYLHEYSQWKKGVTMLHNEPINLKISTVRPCRNQDRRFCFEVITPKYRRVYQATSAEDMNSWISVIFNAIQSLLNGPSNVQGFDMNPSNKDGKTCGTIAGDGLIPNSSWSGRTSMDQSALQGQWSSNNGSSEFSGAYDSADAEHLGTRLLKAMRELHPSNNFCAECGAKSPDWCAINLGILICIECSGIHRGLGTHISKVRSFTLDTTSYTRDLFDFVRSVGNEVSNKIWEANLVQSAQEGQLSEKVFFRRPLVNDSREYKISFVQKKYAEKAFVRKFPQTEETGPAESQAILATKALFQAVVVNNIVDVIAAFAAGADLNAIEEAELEKEMVASGSSHAVMESDETAGSLVLDDSQIQSSLEGLSLSFEGSSRFSRSTIASSIAGLGQESQNYLQLPSDIMEPSSPSSAADNRRSSFMVMQTSPLLLALRNGIPFSLDEQYEVYPMAEFMLQNGAASNLSVEVRFIDDETEGLGSIAISEGASGADSTDNTSLQQGLFIQTNVAASASKDNDWDFATQVDPEDILNLQQRSNRRSLGQVVNLRGEEGASAMEYLRAKSAARGERIGSPPLGIHNNESSATGATPPFLTLSPRLRSQYATLNIGSMSAPTPVIPSSSVPGTYSTAVFRQQPSSTHQDISSLFLKRRESDASIGPVELDKKFGVYKLQNAASVPSSPTTHELAQMQTTPGNNHGHSHGLLHHSRAHKVKASLSKSLRLSAAYIKNNMLKEEKEIPVPAITQTIASPILTPAILPSSSATKQKEATLIPTSTAQELSQSSPSTPTQASFPASTLAPTSAPTSTKSPEQPRDNSSLSGSYVFLHKKGTIPVSNATSPPTSNPNSGSSSSAATNPSAP
ncbi:hypothetical protein BGX27_003699 [Mortierella sp. AM989]|nr:hypothetical protein BGX27_003699 [Mortierella sp. AM989]